MDLEISLRLRPHRQKTKDVLLANPTKKVVNFFRWSRRLSIFFDEKSRLGATTERLDAKRPRAGKRSERARDDHSAELRKSPPSRDPSWANAALRRGEAERPPARPAITLMANWPTGPAGDALVRE